MTEAKILSDHFAESVDGGWEMEYAAKAGPLDSAINRSLFPWNSNSLP
jgi:hypothetical protein